MAKYRIEIDQEACLGELLCSTEAPGTFDFDDEGKAVVVDPEGDLPEFIRWAAEVCPIGGITLYDAETGEKVWPPY